MDRFLRFVVLFFISFQGLALAQGNSDQPKDRFSGLMFGDFFYNVARDSSFLGSRAPQKTALSGTKDQQGFQFRRIYFTWDHDISSQFTTRFRMEADQTALTTGTSSPVLTSTGTANVGSYQGKITVFVKDAFLRWKNLFEGSDLIFGIQPTTAYDISETWWGYRSLEKTIQDLHSIIPSRDMGIALRGKITGDGMFNYWAMIANGDGNSPVSSKFKRYSLNLQVKPDNNWQATINGDYRAQASVNDPTSTSVPEATESHDILTGSVFVGYKENNKYSFGVEGFLQSTMHDIADSANLPAKKGRSTMGISVWGSVNLQDDIALVARYDYFDPNSDSYFKGDSRNYIIGGLDWKPDKNVSIMPNVQIETLESLPSGHSFDTSVTGRLTFYYVFM